jgi:hypothetical protein
MRMRAKRNVDAGRAAVKQLVRDEGRRQTDDGADGVGEQQVRREIPAGVRQLPDPACHRANTKTSRSDRGAADRGEAADRPQPEPGPPQPRRDEADPYRSGLADADVVVNQQQQQVDREEQATADVPVSEAATRECVPLAAAGE